MNADQERHERRRLKAAKRMELTQPQLEKLDEKRRLKEADRQLKDKRRAEEAKRTERLALDAMPVTPKSSDRGTTRPGVMIARLANFIGGTAILYIPYSLSHLDSASTSVPYILLLFLVWFATTFVGIGLLVRAIFAGESTAFYSWQSPKFLAVVAGIWFLVIVTKVMFGLNEEEAFAAPSTAQLEAERQKQMDDLERNYVRSRPINRQTDRDKMDADAQLLSDYLRSQGVGISPAEARALLQTEKELENE